MKTFEYQGFATSGGRARGLIEADDVKQARDKLSARGVLPETVRPVDPARAGRGRGLKNPAARAALYRQLASLLRSGLPLAGALEVLLDTPEEPALHAQLAAWRDRIREGGGPAEALRAVTALSL